MEQVQQPEKKNEKMLIYRVVLILLILALLIYSIAVFLTRGSGAWLSQEGTWAATYETGVLDFSLDTNGNTDIPVAVKLLGGTKLPEQDNETGDPLFNSMVLPVTIHLENTGTVDLRAKLSLSLPPIGQSSLDTANPEDNGILYMVLPLDDPLVTGESTDYRNELVGRLNGITTQSDYAALKKALGAYNEQQLTTYIDTQKTLFCDPERGRTFLDIRILFWADYDKLLEYNQVDFLTNDQVLPSWYNFVVHVYTTQAEAPESELTSK